MFSDRGDLWCRSCWGSALMRQNTWIPCVDIMLDALCFWIFKASLNIFIGVTFTVTLHMGISFFNAGVRTYFSIHSCRWFRWKFTKACVRHWKQNALLAACPRSTFVKTIRCKSFYSPAAALHLHVKKCSWKQSASFRSKPFQRLLLNCWKWKLWRIKVLKKYITSVWGVFSKLLNVLRQCGIDWVCP